MNLFPNKATYLECGLGSLDLTPAFFFFGGEHTSTHNTRLEVLRAYSSPLYAAFNIIFFEQSFLSGHLVAQDRAVAASPLYLTRAWRPPITSHNTPTSEQREGSIPFQSTSELREGDNSTFIIDYIYMNIYMKILIYVFFVFPLLF